MILFVGFQLTYSCNKISFYRPQHYRFTAIGAADIVGLILISDILNEIVSSHIRLPIF
jgi:hypothetical protein